MTESPEIKRDRILGGLWGCSVGDALGVPVEFQSRHRLRQDPVTGMREGGAHGQLAGTWSDDTSLMLCLTDSLVQHHFDTTDMAQLFLMWYESGHWTPHGTVFDIGNATRNAISAYATGTPAEQAGGRNEYSNGNGSLMRQLPVALRFADAPVSEMLDHLHRVSSITHGHLRSLMACGFHGLVVRELLNGVAPQEALKAATQWFKEQYGSPEMLKEQSHFGLLLEENLALVEEKRIGSDGYVTETLTAALWCLLTTESFEACVLKAVNLGGDSDTTGCVAGGLAGVHYGLSAVSESWRGQLARSPELGSLFSSFSTLVTHTLNPQPSPDCNVN